MSSFRPGDAHVPSAPMVVGKLMPVCGVEEVPPGSAAQALQDAWSRIAALEEANRALRGEALCAVQDRLEAVAATKRAEFLLAEVEHRLKNSFAVVQAVATQTRRSLGSGEAFHDAFDRRLRALAGAHAMLGQGCRDEVPLAEVIALCLEPYGGASGQTSMAGPGVHLPARNATKLGLMVHELATNAAKHGALSGPEGRVEVTWRLDPGRTDQEPSVEITWRERGGPLVHPPRRRGFGSRLLGRGSGREAGLASQLDFAPHGVDCRIWMQLEADVAQPASPE